MHEEFVEDLPRQQSYLEYLFSSLGWRYSFLLPLAALVSFVLVLVLVLRGKGSSLPAALMLIVPLPVLVGLVGVVDGIIASYQVIAMSDVAPKPSALAQAISMSWVSAYVGAILTIPGFLVAAAGTFVRSLIGDNARSLDVPLEATIVPSKR